MIMSALVLVTSGALFLFYIQAICERALRREFSRAYFQDVLQAIQLEYPLLRDSLASNTPLDCTKASRALKRDFSTLEYLLKNGPERERLGRAERLLAHYFRFLLFCLPLRHALKLQEREAVLSLTAILQYFANSVGEKLSASPVAVAAVLNS